MKLSDILHDIDYTIVNGNIDIEINKIDYDSRNVGKDDLFFCIEGFSTDGHNYIGKAYQNGVTAIVVSRDLDELPDCTIIKVTDSRKALALASQNYYDHPAKKLKLIGVTGTNGKTTTTFMIKAILEDAGYKVGLIGTISNYIGEVKIPSHRTTPESLELNALFKDMVDSGVEYCVMEVSSHSLALDRVYGLVFSEAIFTNLTQDHLDFHKTFENYFSSKLILFKNSLNSIINMDDSYGKRVFNQVNNNKITCSINEIADVMAYDIEMHSRGINFNLQLFDKNARMSLNLPGRYNIYNALGCAAACAKEGISIEYIKSGLEKVFVPGRCEIVTKGSNLDFDVILDYAHTPDGLENILKTAREFTRGRLISIFGCGGDRDNTKRPIMGNIGTELSDFAIITSDNPRSEEPMKIIEDILSGVNKNNYIIEENRRDAIKKAMEMARKDDVIVLAGKGHEDYQILKDKTIHFDEKEIVSELIKEINKGI